MFKIADYLGYERAFKNAGIRYTIEPGAFNRGHGDIISPNFLVLHHTAGGNDDSDIRVVRDGRPGLPGPLSQMVLKRDGSVHIIAVGVCWHAGPGPAKWGAPQNMGNYYSLGIEGVSNGYNDWTAAQRDAYPKVVAALLKDMKLPADRWIFHRDYNKADGKIDPAGFDAGWFDRQVRAALENKPVETAIQAKRRENAWLGNKTIQSDELPTADGVGRWASYEHGHIYWHPNFGAKTIRYGTIFEKYQSENWEIGFLGYPLSDGSAIQNGEMQTFQGGSIYWNNATKEAHIVKGDIGGRWAELGWETGKLGFPQTDEIVLPDGRGRLQRFEKGHIYWSPETGAKEIYNNGIWEEYARLGYEKGDLGYPVGIEVATLDRRGTVQSFQNGAIYLLSGKNDGHAIWGEFMDIYARLGFETGRLGMPISDVYKNEKKNTIRADFEAGSIEQDLATKDIYLVLSGKRVEIERTANNG